MDPVNNPYAPGAGIKPPFMAGRDNLVDQAFLSLQRAERRLYGKSLIAVGLRGVGKTVVLNRVRALAEDNHNVVVYIEARDDSSLAEQVVICMKQALMQINRSERAKDAARKALAALRNFAGALRINMGDVSIELGTREGEGTADSGDLETDLPELFQVVGEAAVARETALAIMVDEMQYLTHEEISALIMAIHRANQRELPIVLIGAGLPQLLGKMGNSKSYSERMFDFPRMEPLGYEDACAAVSEPATRLGVDFATEALDEIYGVTQGYPYFLQEWASVAWNSSEVSPITRQTIVDCSAEVRRRLDESFFRVRLERMTQSERRYMQAMAGLGPGPHSSGDIAKGYGAKVTSVAPIRSKLIDKGMIYSPSHGSTDFTVPLFDQFVRREMSE